MSVPDRTKEPDTPPRPQANAATRRWRIADERADSEVGGPLVQAQWRELMRRYGVPEDRNVADDLEVEHLAPPRGVFLVGWAGATPVACGGVRHRDATTGEVKRMYVTPEYRGNGYSRLLLRALEERARNLGFARMVLETGTMQPEAIALYESEGYVPIESYGFYAGAPDERCYGKDL